MHRKNADETQGYPDNKEDGNHLDITEVYDSPKPRGPNQKQSTCLKF